MSDGKFDFALAIGGEAGQGIATPGDTLARLFVRRGLHLATYNAYQSIIRGGHIFLTVRVSDEEVLSHGDRLDMLLSLNQDTIDRHLRLLGEGAVALYNSDTITPGEAADGVQLCPLPVNELTGSTRAGLNQNTVALGAMMHLLGLDFGILESSITQQFARKGEDVVNENVRVALAGYTHAQENFVPFPQQVPDGGEPKAMWSGNEALAMGGAAAGVKFYAAYPMSPSTGVLHWYAQHARNLGIMVRQVEDEIGVANMVIGAAHTGTRAMCATSGGGFALMTEAIGAAAMMEIPCVFINVQRAGPSTGVPTKTEQGDLWQALGASQGDFQRLIVSPLDAVDAFNTVPEVFNHRGQAPVSRHHPLGPAHLGGPVQRQPGPAELPAGDRPRRAHHRAEGGEWRPVSPLRGHCVRRVAPRGPRRRGLHPHGRDRRTRRDVAAAVGRVHEPAQAPRVGREAGAEVRERQQPDGRAGDRGPADAEVTLVGWGSTYGVIKEAIGQMAERGVKVNHLPIKWLVPFHADEVEAALDGKKFFIVENNQSGQFARYLRGETGLKADGHIRKYDGEPFAPHHIADGVAELLEKGSGVFVPQQEIIV